MSSSASSAAASARQASPSESSESECGRRLRELVRRCPQTAQGGLELDSAGGSSRSARSGHRAVVERQLSPQVSTRRQHEQRPPDRRGQFAIVQLDGIPRDEREHRRGPVRLRLPQVGLEVLEDLAVCVHEPQEYDRVEMPGPAAPRRRGGHSPGGITRPASFRGCPYAFGTPTEVVRQLAASPSLPAGDSNRRLVKTGVAGLISSAEWVSATYYLRPRRLKMYIGGGVLLLILIILLIIFLL